MFMIRMWRMKCLGGFNRQRDTVCYFFRSKVREKFLSEIGKFKTYSFIIQTHCTFPKGISILYFPGWRQQTLTHQFLIKFPENLKNAKNYPQCTKKIQS